MVSFKAHLVAVLVLVPVATVAVGGAVFLPGPRLFV